MSAPTNASLSYGSHPTLYFGVELEFSLGWVDPNELDTTDLDPRANQFRPAVDEQKIRNQVPGLDLSELGESLSRDGDFYNDLPALRQANLPVQDAEDDDLTQWTITDDTSIRTPKGQDDRYKWTGIEVISPAYQYTSENIAAVKTVCDILKNEFLIINDESTGLHVHVSYGLTQMWDISTLRKLLQFFWAFNKQFDSIHPAHRQQHGPGAAAIGGFAVSMRSRSHMARQHWDSLQVKMSPSQGVVHIGKQDNWTGLLKAVSGNAFSRFMAYNVATIVGQILPGKDAYGKGKPTVEFRQHAGSVDPEAVTNWISTLCSIVKWVDIAEPEIFNQLIMVCKDEWVKSGDQDLDDKNELWHGPVMAEGSFTIIDLLEHMNLQELADFYRTRLHPVVPELPIIPNKWKHEAAGPANLLSQAEKQRAGLLKEIWLKMNAYQENFKPSPDSWHWDPDHSMWPAHEDFKDEGARAESPPPLTTTPKTGSEASTGQQ